MARCRLAACRSPSLGKTTQRVKHCAPSSGRSRRFANARAPLDVVGTGSFIPENFPDTFATADIYMYEGKPGIKLGREKVFQGLKP